MNVLVHLPSLDYDDLNVVDKDSLARDIVDVLTDDADDGVKCGVEPSSIILGGDEPQKIIDAAKRWNDDIRLGFVQAANALIPEGLVTASHIAEGLQDVAKTLPMDDQKTFAVFRAAQALDSRWDPFGPYGAYLPNPVSWAAWKVVLDKDTRIDIAAHPENYALATASVS